MFPFPLHIFKFEFESTSQVLKYINEIDCNKSLGGDIPAKFLKMAKEKLISPNNKRYFK